MSRSSSKEGATTSVASSAPLGGERSTTQDARNVRDGQEEQDVQETHNARERREQPVERQNRQEHEQEAPVPTGVELASAFKMISHQFMRWGRLHFNEQRLSIPRMMVLATVAEHGLRVGNRESYLRMHDIARELGVTPRNVTTIVDGLEREGLLARRRDTEDRRAIRLELTPLGKEQIEEINQLQHDISEAFFAPLDAEQRRQLLAILTALGQGRELPEDEGCFNDHAPSGESGGKSVRQHVHEKLHEFHEAHERYRRR